MGKVISVFSVISVRKLTQVFVSWQFCCDFGPDHAFQLLTLPAGLVSLLAFVPAKFQRLLLPRALLIAWPWDLSGMWPVCSCTDFSLSASKFPGKHAFLCILVMIEVMRIHGDPVFDRNAYRRGRS